MKKSPMLEVEIVTGEQFVSGLRIDQIQVDALIVAEKQNAAYMCDDLFFRKLASLKKIKNVNFTFLAVPLYKSQPNQGCCP